MGNRGRTRAKRTTVPCNLRAAHGRKRALKAGACEASLVIKHILCNLEACMHDRILSAKKILSFFSFHL